jgi:FAD/FMN-containing dehydrogenase
LSTNPPPASLPVSTGRQSWGRVAAARHRVVPFHWRDQTLPRLEPGDSMLPFGLGRSYGDSCLNDGHVLITTDGLDRWMTFDRSTGVLRAEAGVSLASVLDLVVPQGWFLPVTPGTQFVTLAGAVANDVHGKNHHVAGTFGRFVSAFELLRSDGSRLQCTPGQNTSLFQATIGGLGLTGLITWVEIQLVAISSPIMETQDIQFGHLREFFPLSAESESWPYVVAWVDCVAKGADLGRGIFMRGRHATGLDPQQVRRLARPAGAASRKAIPFNLPSFTLNALSVRAFNALYYRKNRAARRDRLQHFGPFFYPLDAVRHWNRLYGRRGFYQYQCVIPSSAPVQDAMADMLERIAASGQASFLAVLKMFGDVPSPGKLSFPRPGATLALDFANRGPRVLKLFAALDEIVRRCGGALYPAKDACMSADDFQRAYPRWREFEQQDRDPQFSSSFWRRVTGSAT